MGDRHADHEAAGDIGHMTGAFEEGMHWIIGRAERRRLERAVDTGFADLDEALGCLQPGQLVILAGRPAMGTTSLALRICEHSLCERDRAVLYVSLGASRAEVGIRLLGMRARVDSYRIWTGKALDREDLAQLGRAYNELHRAAFRIVEEITSRIGDPSLRS